MKIKTLIHTFTLLAVSSSVMAKELDITITNLTQGLYFTPIIAAAHTGDVQIFSAGEMASSELTALAEGGDVSGLVSVLTNGNANTIENPAMGLLAPTMSTNFMLTNDDANMYLSFSAMILPSNDGFVGVNRWVIPQESGTYTAYVNAYDAGTEANDEVRGSGVPGESGMPVPPPLQGLIGTNGTGVTMVEENTYVHIHRGNLGDSDMMAGKSDINNSVQRWLNPVAKLTVVVK
ncbi:MAG: spondin domain-containing protein [Litorilituus sp.]|nr:spondin domain-containing protein [Litorilituus sp.]